jgi:hypothetical protein
METLVKALHDVNEKSVVMLDLNPENIFVRNLT